MIDVDSKVKLNDVPDDLSTPDCDNAWLKRIRTIIGDEVGTVVSRLEFTDYTLYEICFPITYGGVVTGIPTGMIIELK